MSITANQFVDRYGCRVLTDDGKPGMDGNEGIGSTTEAMRNNVAVAIFANCKQLDDAQLDEIIGWVRQFKMNP